jgi:4-amino-4-deoxy-L-arabinose transferase-like glycosyltransferase
MTPNVSDRPLKSWQRRAERAENGALIAILLLAGGLNFYSLAQNGYGNSYYAAAVRSMLASWRNFFFVSFDPAGFVSVDKPPLGLWLQVGFVRIFGFNGVSLAPLLAGGALLGAGFNIRGLEAWLALPILVAVYLVATQLPWRTRLRNIALMLLLMLALSVSWVAVVDQVPASQRPYVDSTLTNSEFDLMFNYNGLQRSSWRRTKPQWPWADSPVMTRFSCPRHWLRASPPAMCIDS